MTTEKQAQFVREYPTAETPATPGVNVEVTLADENTNAIGATVQVRDGNVDLAGVRCLRVWLSASAGGAVSAVTTGAITTGVAIQEIVANGHWIVTTSSTGSFVMTGTIAGAATRYLCIELPNGEVSSTLITWAA